MLTNILLTINKDEKKLLNKEHKTKIIRNKDGFVIGVNCVCGDSWIGGNSLGYHEEHQANIIAKKRGW